MLTYTHVSLNVKMPWGSSRLNCFHLYKLTFPLGPGLNISCKKICWDTCPGKALGESGSGSSAGRQVAGTYCVTSALWCFAACGAWFWLAETTAPLFLSGSSVNCSEESLGAHVTTRTACLLTVLCLCIKLIIWQWRKDQRLKRCSS